MHIQYYSYLYPVNYVSHFFCSKKSNPYYSLGLMIPDLFPKFSFYHNQFFLKYDSKVLDENERNIWLGIEQHYSDDAYFHAMPEFKIFMNLIEDDMKKTVLSTIKRQFIVSHVLYELILDNMILDRYPDIVGEIYADADQISRDTITQFLLKIMGKHSQNEVFLEAYGRFMERRFLNFYSLEANLVKALHRVTGEIGQWQYNEVVESAFIDIIQNVKKGIDFDTVFEKIKTHKEL